MITSVLLVILSSICAAFGALKLKISSANLTIRNFIKNKNFIYGVILYGLSAVLFLVALKKEELSFLYPFVSASYIFTIILSKKYLDEKINKWKLISILFIIIGIILIGLSA